MIFPKKCLGCPPFLGYICWPKVVGALFLLSATPCPTFFPASLGQDLCSLQEMNKCALFLAPFVYRQGRFPKVKKA